MRLLSGETQFDFMGQRRVAVIVSAALLVISVLSLVRGFWAMPVTVPWLIWNSC